MKRATKARTAAVAPSQSDLSLEFAALQEADVIRRVAWELASMRNVHGARCIAAELGSTARARAFVLCDAMHEALLIARRAADESRSREYHLSQARQCVRGARCYMPDGADSAHSEELAFHLADALYHREMARRCRSSPGERSRQYRASHLFRQQRDQRRGVRRAPTAVPKRRQVAQTPHLADVREAAVAVASELATAAWLQPSGEAYPDHGWAMVRGCTIAVFYEAFARHFGMEVPRLAATFPELGAVGTRALALACGLPELARTPEHFGHVHETLVGYGLTEGKVSPTDGRRDMGAHFTPPQLAHRVMRRTIKPLLRILTMNHPAGELGVRLLGLRVCDPAVGAGAFLLALVRYLARFAVYHGAAPSLLDAKRAIAVRCALGVDKDRYAVFTARLALAMECREHRLAGLLEQRIRHGDALVGLDREQLLSFHWKRGEAPIPAIQALYDRAVGAAAAAANANFTILEHR